MDLTAHDDVVNPNGFTVLGAFDGDNVLAVGGRRLLTFGTASASDIFQVDMPSAGVLRAVVNVASVTEIVTQFGAITAGRNVFAVSVQQGACLGVVRGGSVVALGTASAVPDMEEIGVGFYPPTGGLQPGAAVELIAIYPRACTAGELTALINAF